MINYYKRFVNFVLEYIERQKSIRLAKKLSKEDPFIYK